MKEKEIKTNAMRQLDAAGISYEVRTYPVDENDLSGSHMADVVGLAHDLVFKTLVAKGDKTGPVVGMKVVDGTEDLLLVTAAGILIRTPVENIRVAGRATQGVIVMRFKEEGDRVISLALADPEEKEQPAPEEAPL